MAATERRRESAQSGVVPVLRARAGGPAERFADLVGGHPVAVFVVALVCGYVVLAGCSLLLALFVTDVLVQVGDIRRTDESAITSLVAERTRLPDGRVERGLGRGRRARPADPRRHHRDRLRAAAQVEARRVRRVRPRRGVGDVPGDLVARPARAARRAAARGPAGRRELPLRAHGRVDRRLRRPRAAAHVGLPGPQAARRSRGSRRSSCRSSSRCRGCTAGCTIRWTSRAACSSASAPLLVLLFACRAAEAAVRSPARSRSPVARRRRMQAAS